jgi:predicted nucleic acid-binding Zn ribbon protein
MDSATHCRFCHAPKPIRPGRFSAYCSNECRDKDRNVKKEVLGNCLRCGTQMERNWRAKYCSRKCKELARQESRTAIYREGLRQQGKTVKGQTSVCVVPICHKEFVVGHSGQKYCSAECRAIWHGRDQIGRGEVIASRVYFGQCVYCGTWKSTKAKHMMKRSVCSKCRAIKQRESERKKNHTRRGIGEMTMTVKDLARRDGAKCNICQRKIDMNKSGLQALGPTIDHILPVSKGGTNDPSNLALAHRRCNVLRGNRQPAQMMLEVTDARATSQAS